VPRQKGLAAATLLARAVGALRFLAREIDIVVVHSMNRLARSRDDLRRLVQVLPSAASASQDHRRNRRQG
jgi:hypothetical protein